MRVTQIFLLTMLLYIAPTMISAQDDDNTICPTIVETAVEAADSACGETGRNEACYGNLTVNAEAQMDATEFTFDTSGDIAALNDIQTLTLSEMDTTTAEWGIAVLRVQANIEGTVPGQNVTFVLFGDVEITDAGGENPMQAFVFRSGIGDAPCAEAPDSGIMVQTPEGVAEVNLTINGVDVVLGSTAFLRAEAPDADEETGTFVFDLLEGTATITVDDVTVTVDAGQFTTIPIDADLQATGEPEEPQEREETLNTLPTALLPEELILADSDETADASTGGAFTGTPQSGAWAFTLGEIGGEGCPAQFTQGFDMIGDISGTFDVDWSGGFTPESFQAGADSVEIDAGQFSEMFDGFLQAGQAADMPPGTTITTEPGLFTIETPDATITYRLESETRFVAELTTIIPGVCDFTLEMIFEYAG